MVVHTAPSGRAVDAIQSVERRSAPLRHLPRASAEWVQRGRLFLRASMDPTRLPFSIPEDGFHPIGTVLPLAADAVLLSSIPGARVACRAFYIEAGLTLTVRAAGLRRSALLAGARVARRFHRNGELAVPRQLDGGRRLRTAWIVEELLPETRITRRSWPDVIDRVVVGVTALWRQSAPRRRPVRNVVPWLGASRVAELLSRMELRPTDGTRLLGRVEELASTGDDFLVGWTHGDPVPNNVLLLGDGRLALLDWERAGRNPLGLDACRMLAALEQPTAAIDRLAECSAPFRLPGVLPMRDQAAVALLGLLPTWADQLEAWRTAGREKGYRIRNARRLRLLEHLLER